jgi:hypothetical protein
MRKGSCIAVNAVMIKRAAIGGDELLSEAVETVS